MGVEPLPLRNVLPAITHQYVNRFVDLQKGKPEMNLPTRLPQLFYTKQVIKVSIHIPESSS